MSDPAPARKQKGRLAHKFISRIGLIGEFLNNFVGTRRAIGSGGKFVARTVRVVMGWGHVVLYVWIMFVSTDDLDDECVLFATG